MQASIRSGTNIVNVQIQRQGITNVNFKEFKPADAFDWVVHFYNKWPKEEYWALKVVQEAFLWS